MAMWKLCVVDDESNRTVVKLVREDYSVGRAEESTIRLTERNISRAHARIFRNENEEWVIEDKGSYTGSFVNGERVTAPRVLKHGDTIQLGDYRLELMDEDQQVVDAKALDAALSAAQLPDRFVVVQGPNVGTVYPLVEQKLLVGRGEECQIALDDASVSRVHVEVLRTEHGLMILDQGSSNGLRINGADLPSAMLRSGDVVELGDVRLKFVPAGVEDVVTQTAPISTRAVEATPVMSRGRFARSSAALFGVSMIAAVGLLVALVVRSSDETPTATGVRVETPEVPEVADVPPPARPSDGPQRLLQEARALADEGNLPGAHRKLAEIPLDSNLRQTEEFRAIEQRWADDLLKAAEQSPDPNERRTLLDTVAKAPEVDSERRSRAANALAKLEENVDAVDVSDLPSADGRSRGKPASVAMNGKAKPTPGATAQRRARSSTSVVAPKPRARAGEAGSEGDSSSTAPEAPETPPSPPARAPKPAPKPAPEPSDSELIRDSPF